jgi:CHAD domain-containing protein
MRDLGNVLGKARDLDVFIGETLGGLRGKLPLPGVDKLEDLAMLQREQAYKEVRAMLDGKAYVQFKADFSRWVESRGWEQGELDDKERRTLESNIVPFARKVLDRHERLVLHAGTHVDKHVPSEMHKLRIECKKLRYAAEFFAPMFAGMDEFINHMRGLQDLLGVMNDVSVTRGLLDRMLDGGGEPEALRYAGGVVGWQACQQQELLYGFERNWEEFVEAKHPWWRKTALYPASVPLRSEV